MRSLDRLIVSGKNVPADRRVNIAADAEVSAQTIVAGLRAAMLFFHSHVTSDLELCSGEIADFALLVDDLLGVLQQIACLDENLEAMQRQETA
jgi:hypothetical protein